MPDDQRGAGLTGGTGNPPIGDGDPPARGSEFVFDADGLSGGGVAVALGAVAAAVAGW